MQEFHFEQPPWVIVNIAVREIEGMPYGITPIEIPDMPKTFAIFSDDDLVERAIRCIFSNPEELEAVQLDSFEELLWYSEQLQFIGCVNVIVDYTGKPTEWRTASDITSLIDYCNAKIAE